MTGFWQGLLSGLAIALPLGAIAVLLLHEGFQHGWRPAAAGAFGVATVDLGYATAAVLAGAAISQALAGHERPVHLLGAAVLVAVAVKGLLGLRRESRAANDCAPDTPRRSAAASFTRFVALTSINPLTAIYFTVLATGLALPTRADRIGLPLGIFVGSLVVQLTLASIGAFGGERLPEAARRAVSAVGYLIVLGYAAHLATA